MRTRITGKTGICGLIGDPVEHTISPALQNAAFEALGLDYVYVPIRVEAGELEQAIAGARAMHLRGLNVTIPHKVAVLEFLDEIDAMAENLGAVNTIVNNKGCLKGYNTDASGFYQALYTGGIEPTGKRVTILGAGGAARAVAFILADKGAHLTILNRDESRAVNLANSLMRLFRTEVTVGGLHKKNLEKYLERAEIVVNTTSVGMLPAAGLAPGQAVTPNGASPIPAGLISKEQVIFDIVYTPRMTPLLAEAERSGARIIGGLEMLVQQGAAAFELWTGLKAPVDVMRRAAEETLR